MPLTDMPMARLQKPSIFAKKVDKTSRHSGKLNLPLGDEAVSFQFAPFIFFFFFFVVYILLSLTLFIFKK
jgi:hypothetical protein